MIPETSNKRRYEDIEQDVGISVSMALFNAADLAVYYGELGLLAVLGSDYSITLNEDDYSDFVFTPTEALIDKIDVQIAADPDDRNTVLLVRTLPLSTDSTPAASRATVFVSREFDKTAMRFQQQQEQLDRAIKGPVTDEDVDFDLPAYDPGKMWQWSTEEAKLINVTRPGVFSEDISVIVKLTQAEYDALADKDDQTLYVIVD